MEHTSFDKQKKIAEKHPAFKDKSGDIKKVVIVRRRLTFALIIEHKYTIEILPHKITPE